MRKRAEEFKINLDIYNAKRLHYPSLRNNAIQMEKIRDLKKSEEGVNFIALPKSFNDNVL